MTFIADNQTAEQKVKKQFEQLMKDNVAYIKVSDNETKELFELTLDRMGFTFTRRVTLIHVEVYEYTVLYK